jgi:hypothetical protein
MDWLAAQPVSQPAVLDHMIGGCKRREAGPCFDRGLNAANFTAHRELRRVWLSLEVLNLKNSRSLIPARGVSRSRDLLTVARCWFRLTRGRHARAFSRDALQIRHQSAAQVALKRSLLVVHACSAAILILCAARKRCQR